TPAYTGVLGGVCGSTNHPTPNTPLEKASEPSREPCVGGTPSTNDGEARLHRQTEWAAGRAEVAARDAAIREGDNAPSTSVLAAKLVWGATPARETTTAPKSIVVASDFVQELILLGEADDTFPNTRMREGRLRLAFEAREAAVAVVGSGGRGRRARSTKGCKSSPPHPQVSRKILEQG
ncbi:hypothetical protein CVT26_009249, partial [Gymnopilus dilepis]